MNEKYESNATTISPITFQGYTNYLITTEAVMVLSVVDMATEVTESVAVSDVVEVEAVEEVVAAHKFKMEMVTLLVCFPTEKL